MARARGGLLRFGLGLLIGVALGWAGSRLFAPDDGVATRRRVKAEADSLRDAPRRIATATEARVHLAVEEGRRAAEVARAELEAQAHGARPTSPPPARSSDVPL
jgi:gas vesicle protein